MGKWLEGLENIAIPPKRAPTTPTEGASVSNVSAPIGTLPKNKTLRGRIQQKIAASTSEADLAALCKEIDAAVHAGQLTEL